MATVSYPHLTLGQIYAALAYYHDHQEVIDAAISQQLADVDRIAAQQGTSLLRIEEMRNRVEFLPL